MPSKPALDPYFKSNLEKIHTFGYISACTRVWIGWGLIARLQPKAVVTLSRTFVFQFLGLR